MNYKLVITTFALLMMLWVPLTAQQEKSYLDGTLGNPHDSLIIERTNGHKIRLTWPYRSNLKKAIAWEQLLDDFQNDFTKVANEIPSYDFYRVLYSQKKSLIIDEISGRETYTVNNDGGMDYIKSNSCQLQGKGVQLSIEFTDHKELLDPTIKEDIETAIAQVKPKFYISAVTPDRYYFSRKQNTMLSNPKPKIKFFIPLGGRVGLLKKESYIEPRLGLGLLFDKESYVTGMMSFMTNYNRESNGTESDIYIGLELGQLGAGFGSEFALKVKSGIASNENVFLRVGINYRTNQGINFGIAYYLRDLKTETLGQNVLWDFKVGFGF